MGETVTVWGGRILKKLEGLPGPSRRPSRLGASWVNGRAWSRGALLSDRAGICDRQNCGGQAEELCRLDEATIAYWYRMSMITCNWFGCCGIALRGALRIRSGQAR